MSDKEKARKKRDYEWYKSLGLCVTCHKQKAESGHTQCLICMMDRRANPLHHSSEVLAKHKQYLKDLRERNRENGVCIVCGKRSAMQGKTYCDQCREKSKRCAEKKRRKIGILPRFMMGNGKLCYICGDPTINESKLCAQCLERCREQMLYARQFRHAENYFEKQCKNNWKLSHL